jgi:hypothetical protein
MLSVKELNLSIKMDEKTSYHHYHLYKILVVVKKKKLSLCGALSY